MRLRNAQERLRSSLRAEEKRVHERFASMGASAGAGIEAGAAALPGRPRFDADGPAAPPEGPGAFPADYDAHVTELQSRYRKLGCDPTRDQVIQAGLLALDHLPGTDLRRLFQSIAPEAEDA